MIGGVLLCPWVGNLLRAVKRMYAGCWIESVLACHVEDVK